MPELLFKDESFKIIGICMQIHKSLGMGLKEVNYKDAMEIDFIEQHINFEREKRFSVKYKGCNFVILMLLILFCIIRSFWRLNLHHPYQMLIWPRH